MASRFTVYSPTTGRQRSLFSRRWVYDPESHFNIGPDYKLHEYKPKPYERKAPDEFKSYKSTNRPWKDPMKSSNNFKPSKFEPTNQEYQYKPSSVGLYGDKPRQPKPVKPKDVKPRMEEKTVRQRRTFNSYSLPSGPDLPANPMGPDYSLRDYKYRGPYKAVPHTPHKQHEKATSNFNYMDRKPKQYDGKVDYNLTKENNLGMRHWQNDFVDDTVCAKYIEGERKPPPREKYVAPEEEKSKEKPKVSPKPQKVRTPTPPRVAIIPVVAAAKSPAPKKFSTTGTNTSQPSMRTMATQHQASVSKVIPTQTVIVTTQTIATQYVPPKGKTTQTQTAPSASKSTQYNKIGTKESKTQTSPLPTLLPPVAAPHSEPPVQRYEQQNTQSSTAVYNTTPASPKYRQPSPDVAPVIVAAAADSTKQKNKTPTQQTPKPKTQTPRTPTPQSYNQPRGAQSPQPAAPKPAPAPVIAVIPSPSQPKPDAPIPSFSSTAAPATQGPQSDVGGFSRRGLPPEVVACIEAYDSAHPPESGRSVPSVQRTLHMTG